MKNSRTQLVAALTVCVAAATLSACGSSSSSGNSPPTTCGGATDGGGVLQPFTAPCVDQGANSVLVTASGEVLALGGYGFPPATADDPAFVDGWAVTFSKVLVTFDHVTLSENPDLSPTDKSQTGALVAQADGPWAVDLHKNPQLCSGSVTSGCAIAGRGGSDERAFPITAFTGQTKKGNAAFDPAQRYAFGFDIIKATRDAKNVNLDAADLADYQEMIDKGYTAFFVGTATFQGTSCTQSDNGAYDFSAPHFPQTVNFRFGFVSPVTNVNCENPDNGASTFQNEEFIRGVALRQNSTAIAQSTFHTDHMFWENFQHDSPAHFDHIAAQFVGVASPVATLEALASVTTFTTGFEDKDGANLPWRFCPPFEAPQGLGAQMLFDAGTVPVNPAAASAADALRNLAEAITYSESTMGHLNADGLCFTQRHYDSPQ